MFKSDYFLLLSLFRRCSVHFGDVGDEKAETDAHTNEIVIQRFNDDQRTLDIHLGFLQVRTKPV